MTEVTLTLPNIHRDGWIYSLKLVGRLIDGVSKLDGALDARQMTITFDEARVSLDEIKDALERGGYPAEE